MRALWILLLFAGGTARGAESLRCALHCPSLQGDLAETKGFKLGPCRYRPEHVVDLPRVIVPGMSARFRRMACDGKPGKWPATFELVLREVRPERKPIARLHVAPNTADCPCKVTAFELNLFRRALRNVAP